MKKELKVVAIGILLILMFTAAFANSVTQTITVKLNDIDLEVNGKAVEANTILYDGTTFVPLRAAAEMLNKEVGWNGTTRTASINDNASIDDTETNYNDLLKEYNTLKAEYDELLESTKTPEKPAIDTSKLLDVGDTAEYGEWEYVVKKVEFHTNLSGSYEENIANGKYVVAIVEFTNNALYEREVGTNFIVKDELGRKFDMDSSASLGYHHAFDTDAWHLEDIGSSFSATMAIAFDVATDSKNLVLYPSENTSNAQGILLAEEVK